MQQGDVVNNRYRVEKTIGGGAYGTVYLVDDLSSPGRRLALKEMVEHELSPEERKDAVELFRREAKILMGLRHEGLSVVIDAFSITDPLSSLEYHYLVMEYIDGASLEVIQKRDNAPFSYSEVIPWAIALAKIMNYLHSQKPDPLIFRDLKPSNIMRDFSGKIWLIDFGIARYFKPGKLRDTYAMGTPGFSPPEQYGSGQSDVRSDIFSFGVTLYRFLSFQDPEQFNFKFPSLKTYAPDVPDWLVAMVMKCIALNPGDRYQSFSEILHVIETGASDAQSQLSPPAGPSLQTFFSIVMNPVTIPQKLAVCIGTLVLAAGFFRLFLYLMMAFRNVSSCILFALVGVFVVACLFFHIGRVVGCRATLIEVMMAIVIIAVLAAILVPGFMRARLQGRLTSCRSNLKNIGTALERFQTDNNGKYPARLEELTPRYIDKLPRCVHDKKSDYSYITSRSNTSYTLYCSGKKHSPLFGDSENFPQYDSFEGLIEKR